MSKESLEKANYRINEAYGKLVDTRNETAVLHSKIAYYLSEE